MQMIILVHNTNYIVWVLITHVLNLVDKLKHLGNYMSEDCNVVTDCNLKKLLFIGYVNKLPKHWQADQHTKPPLYGLKHGYMYAHKAPGRHYVKCMIIVSRLQSRL